MDYSQFIFALAVIIIGVVRWFIENRNNAGNEEQRDSDLPEWQWPTEEKQQAPPPPLPTTPPPTPPIHRSIAPAQPPRQVVTAPSQPPSSLGSLSALQHKIAEAKKRAHQAEAQRIKFASKSPRKEKKSAPLKQQGMDWLLQPESLRRAIIAREILGPPLASRDHPDSEIR